MRSYALVALLSVTVLDAADSIRVRWEETPGLFAGRTAVVTLKSGKRVEGDWLVSTPDTFTILRNGERRTFPRGDAQRFQVRSHRVRGRVWGTIGGMYGIGALGTYASHNSAAILPSVVGGGVLGYFLGRSIDRSLVLVEIEDPAIH